MWNRFHDFFRPKNSAILLVKLKCQKSKRSTPKQCKSVEFSRCSFRKISRQIKAVSIKAMQNRQIFTIFSFESSAIFLVKLKLSILKQSIIVTFSREFLSTKNLIFSRFFLLIYRLWKWRWRWMHLRRIWTKRRFCPRPNHQWVKVWTSSRMSSPLFCFSYFSSIFSVKTLRLFNNNTTLNFDVFTNFFWMPKNENYFSWMIQGLKMLTELSKDASKMSQSQIFLRKNQKLRKSFFSHFLAKNRQFCNFDQKN